MTQTDFRAGDRRALRASRSRATSYRVLSYGFRFRSDLRPFGESIDRILGRFRIADSADLPTYSLIERQTAIVPFALYLDDELLQEGDSFGPLLQNLIWHVNSEAVAQTEDFLLLHAAAASWQGQGVLLPAPEDSGKSTLVAALTRAGFTYLTDEAALIDPATSLLHPYPRALWMDSRSLHVLDRATWSTPPPPLDPSSDQHHVLPEEIRPEAVGGPCPVRFVILPSYREGVDTTIESVSRGAALVHMGNNAFNFGRFGSRGFRVLAGIVEEAECFQLRMGDLWTAVRLVLDVVAGDTRGNTARNR